jgi:hypothetical protein
MSDHVLTVPESVYVRASQIAAETSRSPDQVLIAHLYTLETSFANLPVDEQRELEALASLSNDALWTIAREQMPQEVQARMEELMEKNSTGELTEEELQKLFVFVARGNRMMVRKAEAAGILMERGLIFRQQDFTATDG